MKAKKNRDFGAGGSNVHPMAHALEWVGRIMAISALMVVPGIAGQWIDKRFGTEFLGLAGFVLGIVSGMAALIAVTSRQSGGRR